MVRTLWNKENCIVPVEYSVVGGNPTVKCSLTGEQIAELMHYNHVILEVVEGDSVTGISNVSVDENNEVRFTYLDNDGNNVGIAVGDDGAEITDVTSSDNTIVYTTQDLSADPVVVECSKSYTEVASLISSYAPVIFLKEVKNGAVTSHVAYGSGIVEDSTNIVTVNFESLVTVNAGVASITNIAVSHFDDESIEVNVATSDIGGGLEHLLDGTAKGSLRSSTAKKEDAIYHLGVGAVSVGSDTESSGSYSFASGYNTISSGSFSNTEGQNTIASGPQSHAEGYGSHSTGNCAHSEGRDTRAIGQYSHTQNQGTEARGRSTTTLGEFNTDNPGFTDNTQRADYCVIIGNGTATNNRSNALAVKWDGGIVLADGTELTVDELGILSKKLMIEKITPLPYTVEADIAPLTSSTFTVTITPTNKNIMSIEIVSNRRYMNLAVESISYGQNNEITLTILLQNTSQDILSASASVNYIIMCQYYG